MGKFSDTKYVNTIDNLVKATTDKITNPYYMFSDKKPTKVTYYSQNIEQSTLDEASGLHGAHVGNSSPFKFNKIKDFMIYGMEQITISLEVGEYGTESSPISGEVIVLPNTIVPRPGDFFSIPYVKENLLFKITGSTHDTLDTGANIYKAEYSLELVGAIDTIENQVYKTYNFLVSNAGTDFKTLIQSDELNLINELEALIISLITKFTNTFFDSRLQTFIFNHDGWLMYDPFMIEFLRRNDVLSFADEYIHVDHAMATNKTFGMDYYSTFFYSLENPGLDINMKTIATADMITDPNSLFVTRLEDYYWIRHVDKSPFKTRFIIFDMDVFEHIKDNIEYERGNQKEFYNLWIAFFNNNSDYIKSDLLNKIRKYEVMDNMSCFYALGVSIFILEQFVKRLLVVKEGV